jgi:hypothetical protein
MSFHEPAHSYANEESGVDASAESIAFETDVVREGPNTISSAVQLDDNQLRIGSPPAPLLSRDERVPLEPVGNIPKVVCRRYDRQVDVCRLGPIWIRPGAHSRKPELAVMIGDGHSPHPRGS